MATKALAVEKIKLRGQCGIAALSIKILEVQIQQAKEWPGLSVEAREICTELRIPDINQYEISGADIKTAILDHHDRQLLEEISNYKKIKEHKRNNFKQIQDYFKGKSL